MKSEVQQVGVKFYVYVSFTNWWLARILWVLYQSPG